jgi:hypothetical protein
MLTIDVYNIPVSEQEYLDPFDYSIDCDPEAIELCEEFGI